MSRSYVGPGERSTEKQYEHQLSREGSSSTQARNSGSASAMSMSSGSEGVPGPSPVSSRLVVAVMGSTRRAPRLELTLGGVPRPRNGHETVTVTCPGGRGWNHSAPS